MLLAAIVALVAVGVYIVSKWRDTADDDAISTSELLSNFREMHSRGELTNEEFRTIKTRLSYKLKAELKDTDHEGLSDTEGSCGFNSLQGRLHWCVSPAALEQQLFSSLSRDRDALRDGLMQIGPGPTRATPQTGLEFRHLEYRLVAISLDRCC